MGAIMGFGNELGNAFGFALRRARKKYQLKQQFRFLLKLNSPSTYSLLSLVLSFLILIAYALRLRLSLSLSNSSQVSVAQLVPQGAGAGWQLPPK